ncbi:MAG: hypothetical protein AAGF55_11395 [Pseudomonadota bacterium]
MHLKTVIFPCFALGLAACGSSGDGTPMTIGASPVSAIYPSTIRDGLKTEYTALQDGLVVYMGARDGTVSEYRVTLDQMGTPADASDDVLFVEKDGGPRRTFTVDEVLF